MNTKWKLLQNPDTYIKIKTDPIRKIQNYKTITN